ncbi:hypothetical protein JCM8202v2_003665 [Rhodotorula sphaerocarpa]
MDPARQRLALGDSDDERPFKAASAVAASKIARFQGQGTVRKSKFELEREAEAERQRKEAEEAAAAYQEFVDAFGGEDETDPSRGSRPSAGRAIKTAGKGFVKAGGAEKYNPLADRPPPPPQPQPPKAAPAAPPAAIPTGPRASATGSSRPLAASFMGDDNDVPTPAKAAAAASRKKRAGDDFLEQLKRDQAARENRLKQTAGRVGASVTALAAREHAPVLTGSYDTGDPLTTNIHVGGLPQNVTEDSLGKMFAQFGPIGSIMWPRLDSGQLASVGGRKLGGFVAYLRRPDAERAAKEMDGVEWGDNVIKISWGKAVPIASRALYEPEPDSEYYREREHHRGHHADEQLLVTVAKKVRDHGKPFEEGLREREKGDPRFAFLQDDQRPSFHYFRMLVDPDYGPPLVAVFEDEGVADIYSSDSEESSEDERVGKGKIGKLALRRFECLLRGLTSSREKIARGMSFALEHADCASYIADILVCSLTIDATPVPRKLARLHLVSDILHNASASVPNAWVYRSIFEKKLPTVFDHLGDIYHSFPGRLKAEQFRGLIEKVLDVWANDWMLFEPGVIEDFKRRLAGLDVDPAGGEEPGDMDFDAFVSTLAPEVAAQITGKQEEESTPEPAAAKSGFKPSFKAAAFAPAVDAGEPSAAAAENVDGEMVESRTEEAERGGDDLDGAPVAEDDILDGAPVAGDDDDLDGARVAADDEELDGAPLQGDGDDLDGAPLDAPADAPGKAAKPEVISVEGDDDGDAMDMGSDEDIFQ